MNRLSLIVLICLLSIGQVWAVGEDDNEIQEIQVPPPATDEQFSAHPLLLDPTLRQTMARETFRTGQELKDSWEKVEIPDIEELNPSPDFDHDVWPARSRMQSRKLPKVTSKSAYWDYEMRLEDNNLLQMKGFDYCEHLDGSYFDASTRLNPLIVKRILRIMGRGNLIKKIFNSELHENCDSFKFNNGDCEFLTSPRSANRVDQELEKGDNDDDDLTDNETIINDEDSNVDESQLQTAIPVRGESKLENVAFGEAMRKDSSSSDFSVIEKTDSIKAIVADQKSPAVPLRRANSANSRRSEEPSWPDKFGRLVSLPIRALIKANSLKWDEDQNALTLSMIPEKIFAFLVDSIARAIVDDVLAPAMVKPIEREKSGWARVDRDAARRFACFMAADGNNHWAKYVERRRKLLRFIDGPRYFEGKLGFDNLNPEDVALESLLMQNGIMSQNGAKRAFAKQKKKEEKMMAMGQCPTKSLFFHGPLTETILRAVEQEQEVEIQNRKRLNQEVERKMRGSSDRRPTAAYEDEAEKAPILDFPGVQDATVVKTNNHDYGLPGINGDSDDAYSLESFESAVRPVEIPPLVDSEVDEQPVIRKAKPSPSLISSGGRSMSSQSSTTSTKSSASSDPMYHFPRVQLTETKPHKLAYFLLVHKDFDQVVQLLSELVDRYTIVLIHVDAKNPVLKFRLNRFINEAATRQYSYRRVRVMEKSFNGLWGHSSLVFAQLAGFFELLDMGEEWDYVVNLSGQDYPLRHNDVVYDELKKNYEDASLIEYWSSMDAKMRFRGWPVFRTTSDYAGEIFGIFRNGVSTPTTSKKIAKAVGSYSGRLWFPFNDWKLYKHHQWMILNRKHVQLMRTSPIAQYFLAYSEFTMIPDEGYFATLMMNNPLFDMAGMTPTKENSPSVSSTNIVSSEASTEKSLINDCKRWLVFPVGAAHPRFMEQRDAADLKSAITKGKSWTRKIDLKNQQELRLWLHVLRDRERSLYWGESWHSVNTRAAELSFREYQESQRKFIGGSSEPDVHCFDVSCTQFETIPRPSKNKKKTLLHGLKTVKDRNWMPTLKEERRQEARAQRDEASSWWPFGI